MLSVPIESALRLQTRSLMGMALLKSVVVIARPRLSRPWQSPSPWHSRVHSPGGWLSHPRFPRHIGNPSAASIPIGNTDLALPVASKVRIR